VEDTPLSKRPPFTASELMDYALKLLGARDYAEKELRSRLSSRAAAETDIDHAVARLRELGFLDESRFARGKAEDAASRRLVGKRRILGELEGREVEKEVIERAVEDAYEGRDEAALALAHLETRLRNFLREGALEDEKTLQRAYGRLRRAGFRHADVVAALRMHSRLAARLDEFAPDDDE
jgi:regulatory protein